VSNGRFSIGGMTTKGLGGKPGLAGMAEIVSGDLQAAFGAPSSPPHGA